MKQFERRVSLIEGTQKPDQSQPKHGTYDPQCGASVARAREVGDEFRDEARTQLTESE